jgi:hypothetical protein
VESFPNEDQSADLSVVFHGKKGIHPVKSSLLSRREKYFEEEQQHNREKKQQEPYSNSN